MNALAYEARKPEGAEAGGMRPVVYVVDDDALVRTAMARLLSTADYSVCQFESAESFLRQHDNKAHGCVILDIAMPGLDGLALQDALADGGSCMPVIFLTGRADVPMCARAMKSGAFDFLTKPVDETVLFSAVARALERDAALRTGRAQREATELRFSTLTPREREVLTHVIAGRLNKQIAADLGTAEKTVKVHRARGMEKMHVRSVAELVRIVERAHPQGSGTSL
ncbi:response regulator [uncultured Ramlibacter sp.]|uniref:response regulator transcription factor n=1 Tax=uncultured Ramlibacter sp. TaxID=260755 RepID=UPI00262B7D69|nr:response regulator [uncultured Ramlibacter sp.]